jgi:hypothetical protein
MVPSLSSHCSGDPFQLLEACQRALQELLCCSASGHQPIHRCWIAVPYGEEEITLLEEEVLPVLAQVLQRVEVIDHELELQQQAEVALEQAEVS